MQNISLKDFNNTYTIELIVNTTKPVRTNTALNTNETLTETPKTTIAYIVYPKNQRQQAVTFSISDTDDNLDIMAAIRSYFKIKIES